MNDGPIFGLDEWKTLHRPLPKDVYEAVKMAEDLVGVEIGNKSSEGRSMGQSVTVWTIITQFLIENSEALKAKAKEWNDQTPRE
jgi:hypothetical protein